MSWWEVNGISLALGSIAGMGTSKSGMTMGWRLVSTMCWQRLGFSESDRGMFGEEVLDCWIRGEDLGCWIQGEDVETFP